MKTINKLSIVALFGLLSAIGANASVNVDNTISADTFKGLVALDSQSNAQVVAWGGMAVRGC